jgi:HAD superfamily hydrolase (TIGR01549 family)
MARIKWVSFDLWGTLMVSHPEHSAARNKVIEMFLYREGLKEDLGWSPGSSIKSSKALLDTMMEVTGHQISPELCIMHMMIALGVQPDRITMRHIKDLETDLYTVFERYPPKYLPHVHEILQEIDEMGVGMSILSNTSRIRGSALKIHLAKTGLSTYFGFMIFSDEFGLAKPHSHILYKVQELCYNPSKSGDVVELDEILHVGDNVRTDGAARKVGMQVLLLNTPGDLKTIPNLIKDSQYAEVIN